MMTPHFVNFTAKRRGFAMRGFEAARSLVIRALARLSPQIAAATAHERGAWNDGQRWI